MRPASRQRKHFLLYPTHLGGLFKNKIHANYNVSKFQISDVRLISNNLIIVYSHNELFEIITFSYQITITNLQKELGK